MGYNARVGKELNRVLGLSYLSYNFSATSVGQCLRRGS